MRKRRRLSDEAAAVLQLFVSDPRTERFGREIILASGIKSGSLYPILNRFEKRELLRSSWESEENATAEGRRPRRLYRLDPRGADAAAEALAEWQQRRRPDAMGGVVTA